jgi:hypothetical protein
MLLAQCLLCRAQRVVFIGAAEPVPVEERHQLVSLLIGHCPHRHQDGLRAGHLERAPQAEDAFAVPRLAD